jgi:hypothetical protein
VKNLKEQKMKQPTATISPNKPKKIRERAGELAMNHGKRAHEAGPQEIRRAKRELLNMRVSSPKR